MGGAASTEESSRAVIRSKLTTDASEKSGLKHVLGRLRSSRSSGSHKIFVKNMGEQKEQAAQRNSPARPAALRMDGVEESQAPAQKKCPARPAIPPLSLDVQREKLQDLFHEFDTDGSGVLEYRKLCPAALKLGFHLSEAQCAELFALLDSDKNGTISIDEFINYFQEKVPSTGRHSSRHRISIRVLESISSDHGQNSNEEQRLIEPHLEMINEDDLAAYGVEEQKEAGSEKMESRPLSPNKSKEAVEHSQGEISQVVTSPQASLFPRSLGSSENKPFTLPGPVPHRASVTGLDPVPLEAQELDMADIANWTAAQVLEWLKNNLSKHDDLEAPAWKVGEISGARLLELKKADLKDDRFRKPGKTKNTFPGLLWTKISKLQKLAANPVEEYKFPKDKVILDPVSRHQLCSIDEFLGRGQYGEVYQVQWRGIGVRGILEGNKLAMKTIRFKNIEVERRDEYRILLMEEILTSLRIAPYANVINVVNAHIMDFCGTNEEYLCFEDMIFGKDLEQEIGDGKGNLYQGSRVDVQNRVLRYAVEMFWGMHHIHSCRVLHQDIKSANIMVGISAAAKHKSKYTTDKSLVPESCFIADFGFAVVGQIEGEESHSIQLDGTETPTGHLVGKLKGYTQSHRSPEVLEILEKKNTALTPGSCNRELHGFTHKSDMWSLGLVILEMYMGGVKWRKGEEALEILKKRDFFINMPESIFGLLKSIFQTDPVKRPRSCQQVAEQLEECYDWLTGEKFPRPETRCQDPLDPGKLGRLHIWMGKALYLKGRTKDAMREYAEGVRVLSESENDRQSESMAMFREMLGKALYDRKDLNEAVKHFEESVAICPENVQYRLNAARVLQELGDLDKARHHLKRALVLSSENHLVCFRNGHVLRELQDYEAALSHFQKALDLEPSNTIYQAAVKSVAGRATSQPKIDEARNALRKATFKAGQTIQRTGLELAEESCDEEHYKVVKFIGKGEVLGLPSSQLYVLKKELDENDIELFNMVYLQIPHDPKISASFESSNAYHRGWDVTQTRNSSMPSLPLQHRRSSITPSPRTLESLRHIQGASEVIYLPEDKSTRANGLAKQKDSPNDDLKRPRTATGHITRESNQSRSGANQRSGSDFVQNRPQTASNGVALSAKLRRRKVSAVLAFGPQKSSTGKMSHQNTTQEQLRSKGTEKSKSRMKTGKRPSELSPGNKTPALKYAFNSTDREGIEEDIPLQKQKHTESRRRRRRSYGTEEVETYIKQKNDQFHRILLGIWNWAFLSKEMHQNLANFRGFIGGYSDLLLLTDYFSDITEVMTLDQAMKTDFYSANQSEVVSKILLTALQLAQAIRCAHNCRIMLQTIAPSAVEITRNNKVRLRPDLVNMRRQELNATKSRRVLKDDVFQVSYSCGTPPSYRSPEIAMGVDFVTPSTCDLWAWALIVLELFGGQVWPVGEGENAQKALEDFCARPLIQESWTPDEVLSWLQSTMGVSNSDIESRITSLNITGKKLISIRSPTDILMRMGITDKELSSEIWDLINCKSRRYDLPEEVLGILHKCFHFDSKERFNCIQEIIDLLVPLVPSWSQDLQVCQCSTTENGSPKNSTDNVQSNLAWASLLNNLGVCCSQRDLAVQAEEFYKLSLKYDQRNCQANFNIGRLYEAYNEIGQATEYFQIFLDLLGNSHSFYQKFFKEQREIKRKATLMGFHKNKEDITKLSESHTRRSSYNKTKANGYIEFIRR